MKYSELPKEIQKHFNRVIEHYNGYFPKDATHIIMEDPDKHFVLLKIEDGKSFLFNDLYLKWLEFELESEIIYKIPDKPWYDPAAVVGFDDKIDMNEHGTALSYKVMDYEEPLKYQEVKVVHCIKYQEVEFVPCINTVKILEQAQAVGELSESDMVKRPNHYQLLPGYEVKDVMKALLDKIEDSNFKFTYYEAGWFQQSMQYFLRFYAKNGLEDLEKGVKTMQFVVNSMKEREGE